MNLKDYKNMSKNELEHELCSPKQIKLTANFKNTTPR